MRERDVGCWAGGQYDLLHELSEVAIIIGEGTHVPLAAIAQQPIGTTLATPIHGGDGKAAATQVSDDFEVLFDVFATTLEQAYGAALRAAGRRPARKAQIDAAHTLEFSRRGPARYRVLCECHQIHATPPPLAPSTGGSIAGHGWCKQPAPGARAAP